MERQYVKDEYPLSEVTVRIIADAMEVHRELGPGSAEVKLLAPYSPIPSGVVQWRRGESRLSPRFMRVWGATVGEVV
jgi:hypothetical protein